MHWLAPSLIASMTGTLILTCLYGYLYIMDRERYLAIWAASWFLYASRFAVALVMLSYPGSEVLAIMHQLVTLASSVLLLSGTYLFVGKRPWLLWNVSSLVIVSWIFISIPLHLPFMVMTLPTFTFLGLVYAATGKLFLSAQWGKTLGNRVTGITFILWGIHKINYPFLRPVEWFAPWGFLLAAVFSFTVAIGTLLIYFESARRNIAHSEEYHRLLFDRSTDPIFVVRIAGEQDYFVSRVNDAGIRMLGYSRDEIIGKRPRDFLSDETRARVEARLPEILSTGRATIIADLVGRRGVIPAEVTLNLTELSGDRIVIVSARDITDRIALSRQEALNSIILDSTYDAIFAIDTSDRITAWNRSAERIFGFGAEEIIGEPIDLIVPKGKSILTPSNRAFMEASREPLIREVERIRKDGSRFTCHYTVNRIVGADGRTDGYSVVARDTTAERETEKKMRMLTGAVEQSSDAIAITDADGIIRYVNSTFERFSGRTTDRAIGTHLSADPAAIDDPDDLKARAWATAASGEVFREQVSLPGPDGQPVHREITLSPLFGEDGTITNYVATGRDISEQMKMRRQIHDVRQFNERVVEAAGVIIVGIDEAGVVQLFNPYAEKITGYTAADMIGRHWLELVADEHRSFAGPVIPDLFSGKGGLNETEYRLVCRDGSHRDVSWRHSLVTDDDGKKLAVATGLDITVRKKIQQSLAEKSQLLEDINRTLEERVKEEVAKREKQEKMMINQSKISAMGDMMSAIAHQWRQPLNALGIYIQDLDDAYAANDLSGEYVQDMIEKSMRLILDMSRTIDNFRDFFKPSRQRVLFDVNDVIRELMSLILLQLRSDDISFTMEYVNGGAPVDLANDADVPPVTVSGFPSEFKQVMINVIGNAREALLARTGGERPGSIQVRTAKHAGIVTITIDDDAGGVDDSLIPRVFEPYFSTKSDGKASGLGLYMSKVIIEEHMHGSITLENADGGARVVINLKEEVTNPASRILTASDT